MKAIIDCNSFFASCERVFNAALKRAPVVILSNNDGCIISRSDEAKALGIPMGAPYFQWKDKIIANGVHTFSSNYILYGDMSQRVMKVLADIHPDIEVYSIDEAFLDLSTYPSQEYEQIGRHIVDTVYRLTGIPVSVGIARTKVLAKLANNMAKRNKTACMLLQDEDAVRAVLKSAHVGEIWGIGYRSVKRLQEKGIYDALQLVEMPESWIYKHLGGVTGLRLVYGLKGIETSGSDAVPETKKSIASTRSFGQPVRKIEDMKEAVATYISIASEKLRRQRCACNILSLYMRTDKFKDRSQLIFRQGYTTFPVATDDTSLMIKEANKIVEQIWEDGLPYKKAGVLLSGIVPADAVQTNLFEENPVYPNQATMKVMDAVNKKFGKRTLHFASLGVRQDWKMRSGFRSPQYTTRWEEILVVKAG